MFDGRRCHEPQRTRSPALPRALHRLHPGADRHRLRGGLHLEGLSLAADRRPVAALVPRHRHQPGFRERVLGEPLARHALGDHRRRPLGAVGALNRTLPFTRARGHTDTLPGAAHDPAGGARHRLPALLHPDRDQRHLHRPGAEPCHHHHALRPAPRALRLDGDRSADRERGGLPRRLLALDLPPRHPADDRAGRGERLGARLHHQLRRGDDDRVHRLAAHNDAAGAALPLYPGQYRSPRRRGLRRAHRPDRGGDDPPRPALRPRPAPRRPRKQLRERSWRGSRLVITTSRWWGAGSSAPPSPGALRASARGSWYSTRATSPIAPRAATSPSSGCRARALACRATPPGPSAPPMAGPALRLGSRRRRASTSPSSARAASSSCSPRPRWTPASPCSSGSTTSPTWCPIPTRSSTTPALPRCCRRSVPMWWAAAIAPSTAIATPCASSAPFTSA